jgi:tetratricopeptide (TPR) repeat protein
MGQYYTADTAVLLGTLGNLYLAQRRYTQAGAEVNRALAILAASSDAAPNDFASVLKIRAQVYIGKGDWQAAEEDLLRAFSIVGQEKIEAPLVLRSLLQSYATVLRKTHRRREARPIERQAAALRGYPGANALVDVTELARRRPAAGH